MSAGNEFSGMNGTVTWVGGSVHGVKAFSITAEGDIGRYNNWASPDGWENLLAGVKRWSGSITFDMESDEALVDPLTTGAFVGQCTTGYTWAGDIMLERITNAVQKNADVIEVTYDFQGDGAPVLPA